MLPLTFRAQAMPYSHAAMRYSIGWALVLTIVWVLKMVDARYAYGPPRKVKIPSLSAAAKKKSKKSKQREKGSVDEDDEGEEDDAQEVVVVTGGSSGLGKALAQMYGMRRVGVAVLDIKGDKDDEEKGVRWYRCDVGQREQVEKAKEKIAYELGTPTILVNNAGLMLGKSVLELTPEEIER